MEFEICKKVKDGSHFGYRYFVANPIRETEKAIQVSYIYTIDIYNPDIDHKKLVWLPKSQVKVYATLSAANDSSVIYLVPTWLVRKNKLDFACIPEKIAAKAAQEWV
jgi:hypothetical protein